MNVSRDLSIEGIPDTVPESIAAVCRSRLLSAVNKLIDQTDLDNIQIAIGTDSGFLSTSQKNNSQNEQEEATQKQRDPD